jgi:hypothetical protein
MEAMKFISVALLLALLVTAAPSSAQKEGFLEKEEGFLLVEDGKEVLFYQRKPKSRDGQFERANYIHPLYGLDGELLTEDFPADHLHHRGIFWAWHQISVGQKKVGDPWAAKDFSWDVREAKASRVDSSSSALKLVVLWKSPLWVDGAGSQKPLVRETTVIRVHRASEGKRKIDFEINLLALENDLRIGGSEDDKGYGGFSPRIRLPEDIRIVGRNGAVEPQILSVDAGPWLDFSGSFQAGKVSGVAILTHPSVPGFPQRWILRKSKSMQNPVYPGRTPVLLSREKPLVLRYRLVIHRGDAQQARIDQLQREYENEAVRTQQSSASSVP